MTEPPAPPKSRLIVEQVLHKIYLEDQGTRWRVYDCMMDGFKPIRCLFTPSSTATHRVFVGSNRVQQHYEFTAGENRELTESNLVRQLRAARYVSIARSPRR